MESGKEISLYYTGVCKENPECDVVSVTLLALNVWDGMKTCFEISEAFPPPIIVHRTIDASTPKPMITEDGRVYTNAQLLSSWMWPNGPTKDHPDRIADWILPNDYAIHVYIPAIQTTIRRIYGKFAPIDIVLPHLIHVITHEFVHYIRSVEAIQKIYCNDNWKQDIKEAYHFITEVIGNKVVDEFETETETLDALPKIFFPSSVIHWLDGRPFGPYLEFYVKKHPDYAASLDVLQVSWYRYWATYRPDEFTDERYQRCQKILKKWKAIGKARGRQVILTS